MDCEDASQEASENAPAAYLHLVDSRSNHQSQQLLPIWDHDIFKIGRDPRSNSLAVENDVDFMVSRNHCEVYVVVYEPTINHVYVRDRKSCNGTFVNGQLIGAGPEITPGYLLEDGDLFANKYRVTDRCLGQGAEAVVCLANDVLRKKQLVCKIVNLDKIQGKNAQEEIRRKFQEADILRQLRHPNILPYVDAITSPHSLYTFTELASGGDLMSFLLRHGTVQEFDARIILRQVVRGLCYLHEKGIVHRDLKPENILLAYSPKIAYHRVMLSDFGFSAVPRRSRMITNAGTSAYQAPEFTMTGQAHTSAVDIWSLGVVTLLLQASNNHDANLNRMDQEEIRDYLCNVFENLPNKPSQNGVDFTWSCLQTIPSERMNALEAQGHAWLCSPRKHLQFFKHLDQRIMSSWKPQDKLKPMPWELPNLYFEATRTPAGTRRYVESSNADDEKSSVKGEASNPGVEVESPFVVPEPKSERQSSTNSSMTEEQHAKERHQHTPWHEFQKPSHPARSELRPKRKRLSRVKDTTLHPLPGLDRHLRPPVNHNHRQNVLRELERSNSKFLAGPAPIIPSTPVENAPGPMPATPQKRRSAHDVIGRSTGRHQLNVPQIRFC
ncbi:hypothetical protein FDECE_11637 [Fusarium decemcellulare]|nr:hypothetical protein FDECE_11637 [Fusarium decemcellulare]